MKKMHTVFWGFLLALSALWWFADTTVLADLPHFFAWRNVLIQYSGVLAIGVMSVSMLLAVRPVVVEPHLGGLDKMYRLHKWLGIASLALSLGHWLLAQGTKWAVGLGWLERAARGPRVALPDDAVRQFLSSQRGLAEGLGEWAFYLATLLMVLALVKRFPYKYFVKTHHVLAATYLALVVHSVVLLQWSYWATPLGVLMGALMAGGSVAAVLVLLGRVARKRKVLGTVAAVRQHAALQVLEVDIQLQGVWAGHEAGQFAYVTLHPKEGAHPFTISSAWQGDGNLRFIIKSLGDYTRTLSQQVSVGDSVVVEGPYGRFNFEGTQPHQVWIGGGIGITPFVARMKALAAQPDSRSVDLFHTTAVYDAEVMQLLERDAQEAGVNLHVLWDARDGLLDAPGIARRAPHWKNADIWFCGPAGFGQSLRAQLVALGMDSRRFHQELFDMR